MRCPLFVVDAFTNRRYTGNPAAVCLLDRAEDPAWMQLSAREMNLSETVFVWPEPDSFHMIHHMKWFSPKEEVALCGHATLAAAHILWEQKVVATGMPITFETLSGRLSAVKHGVWIDLDFPALDVQPSSAPTGVVEALGVTPTFIGRSRLDCVIEVATEDEVATASPDFPALRAVTSIRGAIITAVSRSAEYDFVSRFFAPAVGIEEDPVTGSAHCYLGPYWAAKLGRSTLVGRQLSVRGGSVRVTTAQNRVILSGQAITVTEGRML